MRRWWFKRGVAAAEWFARIRSGSFDLGANTRWQSWLKRDSGNSASFERMETAWESAGLIGERAAIQGLLREVDRLVARSSAPRISRNWRMYPVAIGLAAIVIITTSAYWQWVSQATSTSYVTAIGEQRVVMLEDQSSVSLNTATSIRVVYSRRSRSVEMLAGEAVFSVVHDEARPFSVRALAGSSTAVGTQYAVRIANPDSIVVSVLEGVVAVKADSTPGPAARVLAGQAVSYEKSGAVSPVRPADLEQIRAWQEQRLVFTDVPLRDAVAEFNRYLRTPVVLAGADIANRRISGVYRIGHEDAFLNALQQLYQVQVVRGEGQILLQPAH